MKDFYWSNLFFIGLFFFFFKENIPCIPWKSIWGFSRKWILWFLNKTFLLIDRKKRIISLPHTVLRITSGALLELRKEIHLVKKGHCKSVRNRYFSANTRKRMECLAFSNWCIGLNQQFHKILIFFRLKHFNDRMLSHS